MKISFVILLLSIGCICLDFNKKGTEEAILLAQKGGSNSGDKGTVIPPIKPPIILKIV